MNDQTPPMGDASNSRIPAAPLPPVPAAPLPLAGPPQPQPLLSDLGQMPELDTREMAGPPRRDPAESEAGAEAKRRPFGSTAAKVIAGCVALALIGAGTVTWLAFADRGDPVDEAGGNGEAHTTEVAPVEFAPKVEVTETRQVLDVTDEAGLSVSLTVPTPTVAVSGVDSSVADLFATTVAEEFTNEMNERLQQYAGITLAECGGERLEQEGVGKCEREASLTIEQAGVYEDFGTVATTTGYILGSRDRNQQVHSVTMNLQTGERVALAEFIDLGDAQVLALAEAALQTTEYWGYCSEPAAEYLSRVEAFSPSDEGVLLLWAVDPTTPAQCSVDRVIVPWPDAAAAAPEVAAAPVAEDINGHWCPTPESGPGYGCAAIALPNASYENGISVEVSWNGQLNSYGAFAFGAEGAPFGDFYPAGTAINIPDYYPGADLPEQDRIWNGQTGVLLLRR